MTRPYIVTENGINKYLLTVDNTYEKIDINDLPPDEFDFVLISDKELIITARKISYDKYIVSWEENNKIEHENYWTADVIEYLRDGFWIMI